MLTQFFHKSLCWKKTFKLVFSIVLAGSFFLESASAEFTIFYHQDGRRLNNIAQAQALIAATAPVAVVQSATLNFREENTPNGNFVSSSSIVPLSTQSNYAVYAVGSIQIETAGDYTFNSFSDDGFSLLIDGVIVSAHNNVRGPRSTTESSIFLSAGSHELEVFYFERTGLAAFELSFAQGNFSSFNASAFSLVTATNPEPQAWALFILSFLGIASMMKRRRREILTANTPQYEQTQPA